MTYLPSRPPESYFSPERQRSFSLMNRSSKAQLIELIEKWKFSEEDCQAVRDLMLEVCILHLKKTDIYPKVWEPTSVFLGYAVSEIINYIYPTEGDARNSIKALSYAASSYLYSYYGSYVAPVSLFRFEKIQQKISESFEEFFKKNPVSDFGAEEKIKNDLLKIIATFFLYHERIVLTQKHSRVRELSALNIVDLGAVYLLEGLPEFLMIFGAHVVSGSFRSKDLENLEAFDLNNINYILHSLIKNYFEGELHAKLELQPNQGPIKRMPVTSWLVDAIEKNNHISLKLAMYFVSLENESPWKELKTIESKKNLFDTLINELKFVDKSLPKSSVRAKKTARPVNYAASAAPLSPRVLPKTFPPESSSLDDSCPHPAPEKPIALSPVERIIKDYERLSKKIPGKTPYHLWLSYQIKYLRLAEQLISKKISSEKFDQVYSEHLEQSWASRSEYLDSIKFDENQKNEIKSVVQSHYEFLLQKISLPENNGLENILLQLFPYFFQYSSTYRLTEELAWSIYHKTKELLYFVGSQLYWPHLADDTDLLLVTKNTDVARVAILDFFRAKGIISFNEIRLGGALVGAFQYYFRYQNGSFDLTVYPESVYQNIQSSLSKRYINIASVAANVLTKLVTFFNVNDASTIFYGKVEFSGSTETVAKNDLHFAVKMAAKAFSGGWTLGDKFAAFLNSDENRKKIISSCIRLLNSAGSLSRVKIIWNYLANRFNNEPEMEYKIDGFTEADAKKFEVFTALTSNPHMSNRVGISLFVAGVMKKNSLEETRNLFNSDMLDWDLINGSAINRVAQAHVINIITKIDECKDRETMQYFEYIRPFQIGHLSAIHQFVYSRT